MDELLSVILLIVVYAIAFSVKGKGKKNKKASPAQRRSASLPEEAFAGQSARAVAKNRTKEPRQPAQAGQHPVMAKAMREEQRPGAAKAGQGEQRVSGVQAAAVVPEVHGVRPSGAASDRQGMRYVRPDQERMQAAGEGEDPCHVGAAPARRREPPHQEEERALRGLSTEDVWRGVVMSEILMRPRERAALRRARRRMP